MAYTVGDVCRVMEELAPRNLAMDWDNVGLQVGDPKEQLSGVLVTLTVTMDMAKLAVSNGCNLIVSHHPMIFRPMRAVRTDQAQGSLIAQLLRSGTAVYASHTNLDQAPAGLNHWLAQELGLHNPTVLVQGPSVDSGLGRIGSIEPQSLSKLAGMIEEMFRTAVRVIGDPRRVCEVVAISGGSGGGLVHDAVSRGADVLITGDVSYHDAVDALEAGLSVIDAGHFGTEKIMVREVGRYLKKELGNAIPILMEEGVDPFAG